MCAGWRPCGGLPAAWSAKRTEHGSSRPIIWSALRRSSGHMHASMPVMVETLLDLPLERQIGADGATWLDRELDCREAEHRFATWDLATKCSAALARRRQWLIEQELGARRTAGPTFTARICSSNLRRRELSRVAGGQLSDELGPALCRRPNRASGSRASIAARSISPAGVLPSSKKPASSRWSRGGRCWSAALANPSAVSRVVIQSPGRSAGSAADRRLVERGEDGRTKGRYRIFVFGALIQRALLKFESHR